MVDANLLIREFLLDQPTVTGLLGTNVNGSIYCGFDLPEGFDPTLGPAIQIFTAGGKSHPEILKLAQPRLQLRVWAAVERSLLASQVYSAVQDSLHGTCNVELDAGYLLSALEVTGPQQGTDPDTGWVYVNSFYAVIARPN